jgi:DNA mismatch endonuclease (patch repair protein)
MVDFVTPEKRSNIMRGSRSKNTRPELRVRQLLHSLGYRFRIHFRDAPGKPDIAFTGRRKAILVHGCFWHQHDDPACPVARRPSSNTAYWGEKFARNQERDQRAEEALQRAGWAVLTVWECELERPDLEHRLRSFLGDPKQCRRAVTK